MKIGILTLTLHSNYGGILQAYALQTVLERMGHEVEVLNRPYKDSKTKWFQIPKRIIKKILGRDVIIFRERRYNKEAPIINKQIGVFRNKYIHERFVNSLHDIKEEDYDCIVVGSDQVWRPKYFRSQWHTGINDAFLAFTRGWGIKRIVYAASLGVDRWELTDKETNECKEAIKIIKYISVREVSSIALVKKCLNRDVSQVLDPTLLLTKDDYYKMIAQKRDHSIRSELLVYILDKNKEKQELVKRISDTRGFTSFWLNKKDIGEKCPVTDRVLPSIEQWLSAFCNTQFVVTDSFHGCVFCILFNKPFVVVSNKTRGQARIQDLLKVFGLKSNLLTCISDYDTNNNYAIDIKTRQRLTELRNQSYEFLLDALKD